MRHKLALVSLVILLLAAVSVTSIVARQARQDPDVLAALLVEVRGLRVAMEQLGAAGPHVQLAMGRLQLNEQRITTYLRRLDDVRDRRIAAELVVREKQQRVSEIMAAVQKAGLTTPSDQIDLKMFQAELADAKATLLRWQNEETKLGQEIATEQDRWAEINRQLEELDRVLARR